MQESNKYVPKPISNIGVIICFFILFMVVYSPIIQKAYLYTDDYIIFTPEGRSLEFCLDYILREGRALYVFLLYTMSSLYSSIDSSKTIRLIGIIGMALFAFVTYTIFKRCRFKSDHAFLMSTLICILPSSQIINAWTACSPYFFGAAMSSLSALICFDLTSKETNKGRLHRIIWVLTAIILLVSAMNIYQPVAMMYWTMGVIYFLARDNCNLSNKAFRQFVLMYFSVCLFSMGLYYLVFMKLIPTYLYPNQTFSRAAFIRPLSDVTSLLQWFLMRPLKHALNLWHLNPTLKVAIFVSAIIFIGIAFNILQEIKENKINSASNYITKYFIISSLVILSYLPFILVKTGLAYRHFVALAPTLSILFCFAIINIVEFLSFVPKLSSRIRRVTITILLTILTVVTAFLAHNNINDFATLYSNEFKYVKNSLKNYNVDNLLTTSKIYFRRPKTLQGLGEEYIHYEFNKDLYTSSEGHLGKNTIHLIRGIKQAEIDGGTARNIIKLALYEIGVKQDIHITQMEPDDSIPKDKDILVIDMLTFQIASQ